MVGFMRVFHNKKSDIISVIIIAIMIFLGSATTFVFASENNVVSIDPLSQIVSPGQTFIVNVFLCPSSPY